MLELNKPFTRSSSLSLSLNIYIYIYNIYIHDINETGNMSPSRLVLIQQWPHGNSSTWAEDLPLMFFY